MNYKTRSTQRGENYSQESVRELFLGHQLPTPVCRQHSITLLLGCRDLFAWRKKKIEHMHARHVSSMVSQAFVHCGPSRRKKQTLPSRGSIHPGTPPWVLCLAPPSLPCSLRDKPTLSRQPEFHSLARPQARLRTSLVPLRCLPVLRGFANEVWTDSSRVQAKKVSRRGCGILLN